MSGTILLREPDGSVRGNLELATGKIFDSQGNTVGQMSPRGDHDLALSDYAARFDASHLSRQVGHPVIMRDHDGNNQVVAMDLGQADVHIDSALPNYAAGYKLEDGVADIAMPVFVTPKASDKFFTWDKENAFKRVMPMGDSPGGGVNEVNPTLSNATYATVEYALGAFVPTQVEANADAPLRPMQAAVARVMNALKLEREIRVMTKLETTANWDSSVVKTVAAGAKWNGGASSDPIADIHTIVEASYMPVTRIVMSEIAEHAFMRNSNVQKYITFKGSAAPLPNLAQFSALLSLPPMVSAKMKYISTGTTLSYVWGNHVVLLHEPPTNPPTSQEDVATGYTFRWTGGTTSDGTATNGWLVRTFWDPKRGGRGGTMVVVTHNDIEVITSKYVGGLIYNAVQ